MGGRGLLTNSCCVTQPGFLPGKSPLCNSEGRLPRSVSAFLVFLLPTAVSGARGRLLTSAHPHPVPPPQCTECVPKPGKNSPRLLGGTIGRNLLHFFSSCHSSLGDYYSVEVSALANCSSGSLLKSSRFCSLSW